VLTPAGWTTSQVIWELRMERLDDHRCRYTNTVTSHPTEDFLKFVAEHGQTFEEAATARQEASGRHCRIETPLYAQSIARWATARSAAARAHELLESKRTVGKVILENVGNQAS
jgi:hypothetical protein